MLISIDDCVLDKSEYLSEKTKNLYTIAINKVKQHDPKFVFDVSSVEKLKKQINKIKLSKSYLYIIAGMLRSVVVINEYPSEIIEIVKKVHKEFNEESKIEQATNRINNHTSYTLDSAIELMRSINVVDYNTMIVKLTIAMYTLIPPLRNDYLKVEFVTNDNKCECDFFNLDTNELCVYSVKSKVVHSTIVPEELRKIIDESLEFMPRKYLYETQRGKRFNSTIYMYTIINRELKKTFGEDNFTVNTFRHIYAEESFKGGLQERLTAAKGMLHTPRTHFYYGVK